MENQQAKIRIDALGLAIVIGATTGGIASIIRAIKAKPGTT